LHGWPTAFITGMQPVRVGMVLPEIPGSPSYLRAGTPHLARFLNDLGYSTGEFGKNHLGDTTESLPTAHGFQEYWGYLYHLDAMQGSSRHQQVPDEQTIARLAEHYLAAKCQAVDPWQPPDAAACALCKSGDSSAASQSCQDQDRYASGQIR
jgi:arylsulfatase